MYVGLMLYVVVVLVTALRRKKFAEGEGVEIPVAESRRDVQATPLWLDRWVPWLTATAILVLLAYGPQLYEQLTNAQLNSPSFPP